MMVTQTRAKRLIKLLERLLKQDHLYSDEKISTKQLDYDELYDDGSD